MTFTDWIQESAYRFRTEPTDKALKESLERFYEGLRVRYYDYRTHGTIQTTLCGESVTFLANNHIDIKRATTLNGEERVAEWLFESVDSDTVFWDVGAYHGHYSVLAGQKGATVIAFEPGEGEPIVEWHANLNDIDMTIHDVALSDSEGAAQLSGPESSEQQLGGDGKTVQTMRGDSFDPKPELVKIDVEGHERQTLDGMSHYLYYVDRIAVEVHDPVPVGAVMSQLEEYNLSTVELESDRTQTYIGGYR
jgi:FkbM family methyltransferase